MTADADGTASTRSAHIGDDWKFTDRVAAEGGMANYPAHDGLAGPSGVASATASDNAARLARLDETFSGGSSAVDASAAGSDTATRLARLDERLVSEGSPAVDASGGSAGETTAFIDESEAYLTKVGYDSSASGSVVTDAHDRGDQLADPTSIADDDAAGGSAPSEGGPNISD